MRQKRNNLSFSEIRQVAETMTKAKKNNISRKLSYGSDQIKVLYIAGPTRSGSTIISNILGQISGFFHAGEIIEAWDRGRLWKCSCGLFPRECPVWSEIFMTLDSVLNDHERAAIIRTRDKFSRSHKFLLNHYLFPDGITSKQQESVYVNGLAQLYATIKNKTGANVIVDSSKNVGYAASLLKVENIDLYVIHLVRDSRATAFSWSKKKQELWRTNSMRTSLEWNSRNLASEVLKKYRPDKYLNLRYEDFIMNPCTATSQILNLLNVSPLYLPFASSHEVIIATSHGLCGNPGRYNHGIKKLVLDNRWKQMKRKDGLVATLLTWPLLLKYRYNLHLNAGEI